MTVDLKHEFTRPLALILAALAALGWVLFLLSSWSTASVQKAQRLQIIEATERSEKLAAELSRQVAASGAVADLETRVAATREDLMRITQAKSDVQSELNGAQKNLAVLRREASDVDRTMQAQNQKLNDLQTSSAEFTSATPDAVAAVKPAPRGRVQWGRRGRTSRYFSVVSRRR